MILVWNTSQMTELPQKAFIFSSAVGDSCKPGNIVGKYGHAPLPCTQVPVRVPLFSESQEGRHPEPCLVLVAPPTEYYTQPEQHLHAGSTPSAPQETLLHAMPNHHRTCMCPMWPHRARAAVQRAQTEGVLPYAPCSIARAPLAGAGLHRPPARSRAGCEACSRSDDAPPAPRTMHAVV